MTSFLLILFFSCGTQGLKTWIPNTVVNNPINWDKDDIPKNCDDLFFPFDCEVSVFWNMKDIAISSLSLSVTGEIIFSSNTDLRFRDREKCSEVRALKFIRTKVKGWLDPNNWRSENELEWLPHSERIPCAGEDISFPPGNTVAVQLPSILLPTGDINFDKEVFRGENWQNFLRSELGFQLFKGPDDMRYLPWRSDIGCSDKKKCICARSSYTIRDGLYRDVDPRIFEEAVCLYAMPRCKPEKCYYPVVPEGHCCGICGAVIKLEDKTEEGIDLDIIKKNVKTEMNDMKFEKDLNVYVGRTKDEHIQIVVVARNSDDTIKAHILSSKIEKKLSDKTNHAGITSRLSGLTLKKYLFNSISAIVFGTFFLILIVFVALFYLFVLLPKKKFSQSANRFLFARFDNSLLDENCDDDADAKPVHFEGPIKAFDNQIYSENSDLSSPDTSGSGEIQHNIPAEEVPYRSSTSTKEYHNLVYYDLVKSENFEDDKNIEKIEEFNEIKL